jgi:RNA-splicing ligase RtcB
MIIKGKYNQAEIMIEDADYHTIQQVRLMCDQEILQNSKIRIMPDACPGIIAVIGTTLTIEDKVMPAMVSSDIGCGVLVSKLKDKRIEFEKLDKIIREQVIERKKVDSIIDKYSNTVNLENLKCAKKIDLERAYSSLGTLGSGNHFIELDKAENGDIYLIIHSGSRILGTQVYEYYMDKGYEILKKEKPGFNRMFTYLEGQLLDDYLHDVKIVQEYAAANRLSIAEIISKGLKNKIVEQFCTIHNYIDVKNKIIRKGAISAQKDEIVIIPINMRDGCIIATGKGNANWNYSAPHGAGRLFSRSETKDMFTVNEYKKQMAGIYTSCIGASTLDECPMAYKDIEYIKEKITDTIEIQKIIKPIYNFKNSSKD